MNLEQTVAAMLLKVVADPEKVDAKQLQGCLRLLAKWRSQLIDNTVVAQHGTTVQAGPFAGMAYNRKISETSVSPRLLGCYESELHPAIERLSRDAFDAIIDIGCADGYYAVGLARRIPTAQVFAYDINPAARANCAELAARNGIGDRVEVGGLFDGATFAQFADRRTLVFLDAEGAEDDLLQPALYPALAGMTVLVECHDVFKPALSGRIADRFAGTHAIERIEPRLHCPPMPAWFAHVSQIDQMLAIWEWREGATPWLFMTPRAGGQAEGAIP